MKLGLVPQAGDVELSPEDLMTTMMSRAKEAGQSDDEINKALAE